MSIETPIPSFIVFTSEYLIYVAYDITNSVYKKDPVHACGLSGGPR